MLVDLEIAAVDLGIVVVDLGIVVIGLGIVVIGLGTDAPEIVELDFGTVDLRIVGTEAVGPGGVGTGVAVVVVLASIETLA